MTSDIVGISEDYGVSNMQIHKYKSHASFLLSLGLKIPEIL
jgi:hypothetical protein